MIQRRQILQHLHEILQVEDIADYCVNGLQVEGRDAIRKIVTGVSVSDRLIQQAADRQADLLIVHHGLFWRSGTPHPFKLEGILKRRVKRLLDADLNLAAYHLPLDLHPKLGNNAQIMAHLQIPILGKVDVGFWGELTPAVSMTEFRRILDGILPDPAVCMDFGEGSVHRVGVISGGSSHQAEYVRNLGIDTFITGELSEPVVRWAEELGLNILAAGHYNSERFGPRALGNHLHDTFGIPVEFVDVPNPV